MKDGIREIVGRTISGVVVKEGDKGIRTQVFILFEGGGYFELYTSRESIQGTSGIAGGSVAQVQQYCADTMRIILEQHTPKRGLLARWFS